MFAQFAFELSASLYDPQEASSFGETKYIYWRTDDQPEQVRLDQEVVGLASGCARPSPRHYDAAARERQP